MRDILQPLPPPLKLMSPEMRAKYLAQRGHRPTQLREIDPDSYRVEIRCRRCHDHRARGATSPIMALLEYTDSPAPGRWLLVRPEWDWAWHGRGRMQQRGDQTRSVSFTAYGDADDDVRWVCDQPVDRPPTWRVKCRGCKRGLPVGFVQLCKLADDVRSHGGTSLLV